MHYNTGTKDYTSPDNYRDLDGNMRTFTYVDHDKKTKINTIQINKEQVMTDLQTSRSIFQEKILALPAGFCPEIFSDFKVRSADTPVIEWNTKMILDEGTPLTQLLNIYTLTSNAVELSGKGRLTY